MFWFYFIRPVQSLAQSWQVKLPIAIFLSYLWGTFEQVLGTYADLLTLPKFLIGMASLAFFLDFFTAVLQSYRENGVEGIQFLKFRQLLVKAAEWALIIMVASNIASGAGKADASWTVLFSELDTIAVFWLTIQDAWSSIKNLRGDKGARLWLEGAYNLAQGELSIDQLDGPTNGHHDGEDAYKTMD